MSDEREWSRASKFAGAVRQKEDESRESSTTCAAYGCDLPGSICSTTHPGNSTEWLCRFHFNRNIDTWQQISARLKEYSWLLGILTWIRNEGHKKPEPEILSRVVSAVKDKEVQELIPQDGERLHLWITRAENWLGYAKGK